MNASVIYLIRRQDDTVDFDNSIFRLMAANVMDADRAGEMSLFLKTLIAGGARKVVVDLKGLEFIDSFGISVIIEAAKMLRQREGDIALLDVPDRIQKIFQPIKLNRFLKIFSSEDEVRSFFKLV
jgi:anti-anti-sigma factor